MKLNLISCFIVGATVILLSRESAAMLEEIQTGDFFLLKQADVDFLVRNEIKPGFTGDFKEVNFASKLLKYRYNNNNNNIWDHEIPHREFQA